MSYCLEALQRPMQPSPRRYVPEPLCPEKRPELLTTTPLSLPTAVAAPFGLTCPLTPWPMILPLVITMAPVAVPWQVVPVATTAQAPSKLPTPPEREAARRGSSS